MKNPRPMPNMNDATFDAIVDNLWDERCTSFEVWSEMGGGYLEFTRAHDDELRGLHSATWHVRIVGTDGG